MFDKSVKSSKKGAGNFVSADPALGARVVEGLQAAAITKMTQQLANGTFAEVNPDKGARAADAAEKGFAEPSRPGKNAGRE